MTAQKRSESSRAARGKRARRRALVVVGMHRSGTSAITRVLSLLGADLPHHVVAAAPDNALGFWESKALMKLHNEVLAAAGSSWHDVVPIPADWFNSDAARESEERLAELVAEEYEDSEFFVVKDPRICRLVPLWRRALERLAVEPSFVMPIRNPLEVADSLRDRNALDADRSMVLWLRHVLDAEAHTREDVRSLISYEALLADWRAVAKKVGSNLRLRWPRAAEDVADEVESFLSAQHRHHVRGAAELEAPGIPAVVRRVHEALSALSAPRPTKRVRDHGYAVFEDARSALQLSDGVYVPLLAEARTAARDETRELAAQLEEAQAEAAANAAELARVEAQARGVPAEIARLEADAGAAEDAATRLARLESQLAEREEAAATASREVEGLERRLAQTAAQAARSAEREASLREEVAELDDAVRKAAHATKELRVELAAAREGAATASERADRHDARMAERAERIAALEAELAALRGRLSAVG